jgi:hypothetical protein
MDNRAIDLSRRIADSLADKRGIAYHEPTRNRQTRSNGKRGPKKHKVGRQTIRRWDA